ncbi:hypothetical protein SM903_15375 [Klebsiella aerogenes]|uniref:hypothetical protein n=1 Tax=Klebsiella aerogenes TaxID=548 RepID=UPI00216468AF|nr:hypothetical protein [Klebsiella aerogenes]WPS16732.1 hypothetical protein SM903_15375 [Klebsiella aerogenes]
MSKLCFCVQGNKFLCSPENLGGKMSDIFVDEIFASMMLPNESALYNSPGSGTWPLHGSVVQGVPLGEAAPDYWRDAIIASGDPDIQGYLEGPWTAITPWFVVYPADNEVNPVSGVRVAVSDIALWALFADADDPTDISKAQWKEITIASLPTWAASYDFDLVNYIDNAADLSTDNSYRIYQLDDEMHPVHGGSDIVCINDDCSGANILAVFSQIKAWLPDAGPEDQILLSMGADYYPNETVRASDLTGVNYLPGAYGSRYKFITSTPQYFYAANVVNPDVLDSNGNHFYEASNPYTRSGGKTYLTRDELMSNPPPQPTGS